DKDVVKTFQMSWDLAPDAAKQVLRVMGELAPVSVPRRLLSLILNLPEQPGLRNELDESIAELQRLSLVELDIAGDPKAHRLILVFARHRNAVDSASPFEKCRETIQAQMERTFANPDGDTDRELESLVPHAEFLASVRPDSEESGRLLNGLGKHHR